MHKKMSIFLVLSLLLSVCANSAYAADVTEQLVPRSYLDESVSVVVVGNYEFTTEFNAQNEPLASRTDIAHNGSLVDYSDKIMFVESLSDLSAVQSITVTEETSEIDPIAIVISNDVAAAYLESGNEKKALDAMINEGHVAFFPETTYVQTVSVFDKLAGSSYNAMPVVGSNTGTVTAFVFKNETGEYLTGSIIPAASSYQANIDARMIKETADNSWLSTSATRSGYADFDPGYKWNELCQWHKNIYQGESTQREWFSEWICFFSAQASDGGHYYAWAGEWCMEPYVISGAQWVSDYVRYESDANLLQDGVQLRDYWPKNEPSTTTGSVSIGVNSEDEMEFGLSYDWEIDDLSFTDNSSQVNDYCKLRWDYSHSIFSNYDEQISYGKFLMIFKDNNKTGEYTFHHYRSAYMYVPDLFGEVSSGNWQSTYTFEP